MFTQIDNLRSPHVQDRGSCFSGGKLVALLVLVGLGIWLSGGAIAWAQILRVYGPGNCDFGTAKAWESALSIGCWVIANTGGGTLQVTVQITGGFPTFQVEGGQNFGPFNLQSGEARVVRAQFSPGGIGNYNGNVTITGQPGNQIWAGTLQGKVGTSVVRTLVIHHINICRCTPGYWVGLNPADKYGKSSTTLGVNTFYYDDGTNVTLGVKVWSWLKEWHKNGTYLGTGSGEHREITVTMNSSFSVEAIFTELRPTTGLSCGWDPPNQPANLQAAAVSSNAIQLTWNYNPGNTRTDGFSIFYSNNEPAGGAPASERSWTDSKCSPNTQYCYYIKACNRCSCGQASIIACAKTPPGAVVTRTLTVNSSPSNGVYITVSPPDKNGSSSGTTPFNRTYDNGTNVTLTAPSTFGGNPFDKWLRDGSYWSSSTTTTVTMDADHTMTAVYKTGPPPPSPPAAPSNLRAIPISAYWIALWWQDNSDNEDGFRIYRKVEGGSYSLIATVGPNKESYQDMEGLTPETTYCYRVKAYNTAGESSYSEDCDTTPPPPAPSAPSDLTATAVSHDRIDLSWTDVLYEDGYRIYRQVQGSGYSYLATVEANAESYSDTGLNPETTYCYKVKAYNAQGESDYSEEACDTTQSPPQLRVTPSTACDLGEIWKPNTSYSDCWTVTNTGGGILTGTVSVDSPFTITQGGSFSLPSSASQIVRVKFWAWSGEEGVTYERQVIFNSNGGKASRTVVGKVTAKPDEDFEGGDFSKFPWSGFGSDLDWFISTADAHGSFSAQAGPLEYGQRASLTVVLDNIVSGNICYWAKISSECTQQKYVKLVLYVDEVGVDVKGVHLAPPDYTPAWFSSCVHVTAGSHTFRWTLIHDWPAEGKTATAWLDDIDFPFAVMPDTPQLSIDGPDTCDFGQVQVGSSAEKDCWTVTNGLGGTLEGTVSVSPPFYVVSGGSFSLGAGASQTVRLRFSPTSAGTASRMVSFTSNGGNLGKTAQGNGFTIGGPTVEDFETGDLSKFPWLTAGDAEWFVTSLEQHQGLFSGKAGPISHNQYTDLWVNLNVESGDISFWFKVSSELDWDFLIFYIDDTAVGWWSGEVDWTQFSYPVSAGQHTFGWMYWKDGSVSSGLDTAWIDDIDFPPLAPPPPPSGTEATFRVTKEGNVYADRAYYGADFQTGTGADIAEYINVSELVEPGDVVELDPERPGYYRKSRSAYSMLVAGVISSAPGITMGLPESNPQPTVLPLSRLTLDIKGLSISQLSRSQERPALALGIHLQAILNNLPLEMANIMMTRRLMELVSQYWTERRPLLALMGVVPVKATTENGPIRPGDLLASASTPGYVMRCDDQERERRIGAIIGKALEPLEGRVGVIRMLVMR